METDRSKADISDYDSYESNLNSLFYTFDKSLDKINDTDIFNEIVKKYDKLDNDEVGDIIVRKTILEMLDNEEFINQTLEKFDITILDLMKTLYRKLDGIFTNSMFLRKVKNIVQGKSYARKYVK